MVYQYIWLILFSLRIEWLCLLFEAILTCQDWPSSLFIIALGESRLIILVLLINFKLCVVGFDLLINLLNVNLVLFILGLLSVDLTHFLGMGPLLLAMVESAYL